VYLGLSAVLTSVTTVQKHIGHPIGTRK
jgi:hypothetical protein